MSEFSSELVSLIYRLLPGFAAAWIFYGLTAHPKATPFERVVQALIFTVVIQGIAVIIREICVALGNIVVLGVWSEDSALVCSLIVAGAVGLGFARFANNNCVHEWLRSWPWYERQREKHRWSWLPAWEWTSRTSFPSEWFSAFSREKRWIILHLAGKRRIFGWPEEWPDQPSRGQFVIDQPEWLLDDGGRAPLYQVHKLLIPARQVEMVEFLKDNEEIAVTSDEIEHVERLLIRARKQGDEHGR